MFKCKFCLRELDRQKFESKSHFGMCKACYTDTMKYKRIKMKGAELDPKEAAFVKRFERQCKHNLSVGEYVPKYYTRGVDTKLDRCPYCGEVDQPRYPHSPNMCYDCGSIANTYANTVRRLEDKIGWHKVTKTGKPAYAYDKALETIDRIEQMYKHNEARGLKVPNLYIRRRMVIVITAYDKAHKLRDGAVCRNCKSDLTIENWAVGCGNICKSCMKEYNRA